MWLANGFPTGLPILVNVKYPWAYLEFYYLLLLVLGGLRGCRRRPVRRAHRVVHVQPAAAAAAVRLPGGRGRRFRWRGRGLGRRLRRHSTGTVTAKKEEIYV